MRRRSSLLVASAALSALVVGLLAVVPAAAAPPAACANRPNNTIAKLLECVTLDGVREHQAAFQEIADDNGGNRFSGFEGYNASVDYVEERLEAAGYDPELQAFDYLAFQIIGPSALEQLAPNMVTYEEDVDFGVIDQSDPGDVTKPVTAVDLQLGIGNTSTSGCEESDFQSPLFPPGNIALLQRGTCTFELKAENAAAAGAVGIVIFNQGNTAAEDRNNIPAVTLTAGNTSGIPVLGTTYALGETLAGLVPTGLTMRVFANTLREMKETYNVLAELPGRTSGEDSVVMVGGHLDSVFAGAALGPPRRSHHGSEQRHLLVRDTVVLDAVLGPVGSELDERPQERRARTERDARVRIDLDGPLLDHTRVHETASPMKPRATKMLSRGWRSEASRKTTGSLVARDGAEQCTGSPHLVLRSPGVGRSASARPGAGQAGWSGDER